MSRFWPIIKLVPIKTNFKFVGFAKYAAVLSVVAVTGSIFLTVFPFTPPCGGLNCGVDFKGGNVLEVSTAPTVIDVGTVRQTLDAMGLGDVQVQEISEVQGAPVTDALVKFETPPGKDVGATITQVKSALTAKLGAKTQFPRTEVVGPKVSSELLTGGVLALALAVGLMMVYIWFRFEWQFALGAVAGLMHDTILVFGLFAVTKMEFSLTAVAAVLTVIGYSMNDTVVVFDRIRENMVKYKRMPLDDLIDLSVNETFSRTMITGPTAIMALIGLAVFGGETLYGFSVIIIFGLVVGTYSSIYVGAPIILLWGVKRGERKDDDAKPIKLGMASRP
jgi:preprotein translocase SecF subunit